MRLDVLELPVPAPTSYQKLKPIEGFLKVSKVHEKHILQCVHAPSVISNKSPVSLFGVKYRLIVTEYNMRDWSSLWHRGGFLTGETFHKGEISACQGKFKSDTVTGRNFLKVNRAHGAVTALRSEY